MIDINSITLSEQGQQRRSDMLDELLDQMQQVHHVRRRRKRLGAAGGSLAVVLMIVVGAVMINHRSSNTQIANMPIQPIDDLISLTPTPKTWQLVTTDPQILNRYRSTARPRAMMVDDQTLLEQLAKLNRPTGLIQIGQRIFLTAAVTDKELQLPQSTTKPDSPM